MCSRVPPGTHMERNHQCKHEIHTNLLRGVRRGGGCPTSVCFHLKVTAFFSSPFAYLLANDVCSGALSECLHVVRVKMMTARKLLVSYSCVAPRKRVRVRRGQSGGGVAGVGGGGVAKSRTSRWLIYAQGHTQIVHLAFCPITGNIQPEGSGPISKESACNERSEARFYHRQ